MLTFKKGTVDNIIWNDWNGVPVSENDKLNWIKDGIQWLRENPGERLYSISSGDSYLQILKRGRLPGRGSYEIIEYNRKRTAYVDRDPDDLDVCSCDVALLSQIGCQCGGI